MIEYDEHMRIIVNILDRTNIVKMIFSTAALNFALYPPEEPESDEKMQEMLSVEVFESLFSYDQFID